jgi:hypothetical protein
VIGNAAMAVISGYQLYRLGLNRQQGTPSKVDPYLKFDLAFSTGLGLWDLLFPREPFKLIGVIKVEQVFYPKQRTYK